MEELVLDQVDALIERDDQRYLWRHDRLPVVRYGRDLDGIPGPLLKALDRWEDVVGTLVPLGIDATKLDSAALLRDGQCRIWWGPNPIDLFFTNDPFHEAMSKRTRRLPFAGETLPFLAPEDLAICKAMFDRPKDWVDIEQMLVATDDLDVADIEQWLKRMVGPDDQRLKRLRDLSAL